MYTCLLLVISQHGHTKQLPPVGDVVTLVYFSLFRQGGLEKQQGGPPLSSHSRETLQLTMTLCQLVVIFDFLLLQCFLLVDILLA